MGIEQNEPGPSPDEHRDIIAKEVAELLGDDDSETNQPTPKVRPNWGLIYDQENDNDTELKKKKKLFRGRKTNRKS